MSQRLQFDCNHTRDKLASYAAAKRTILPHAEHRQSKYLNNRAEVLLPSTHRRERQMQRFKSARHAQRFLSVHARIRSVALNILRANGIQNISLALYANAVSFDHLLALSTV